MIKINNYALTMALLTHGATHTSALVEDGSCSGAISQFTGATKADCTYQNFLANLDPDCNVAELFPGLDQATIEAEVADICEYDAPTQFVEIQGYYQSDKRYFAGGGPLVDGENWGVDVAQIQRFEANAGSNQLIAWPEYAARLDYNNANGLGDNGYPANMNLETSCQLNTAMCCFTDDSMGPGFPVDKTTDVCRHDLYDSPQSNHIKDGWSVFPGGETSTYCVGFTWNEGEEELIGNMMYDISLRNTALYGYREGVPGAPMCGCVEHMPEVETAECRTATKNGDITFTFNFDATTSDVSASNSVDITYSDCGSDLKTAYKAKPGIAGVLAEEEKIDSYLVTNCDDDLTHYLNEEQFLHVGQHATKYITPESTKWSDIVVGEGIYFQPPNIDPAKSDSDFRSLIENACYDMVDGQKVARHCIIRRACASCRSESHRDIYYKRISDLPPALGEPNEIYFLDMFMNNWGSAYNLMDTDFKLYSTYEDALADTNSWEYCDYQSSFDNYGFPRNCGPAGAVWNEWNSYVRGHGYANHHGFYVEKME
jgi:hypothetical protein